MCINASAVLTDTEVPRGAGVSVITSEHLFTDAISVEASSGGNNDSDKRHSIHCQTSYGAPIVRIVSGR